MIAMVDNMKFLIWLAVLPSLIIGILIYKADRMEKEPKKELLKAFLFGVLSVVLTLIISSVFSIIDANINSDDFFNVFIYSFFGIALIEEFSKWICSWMFLRKNKNFDYLFDGIVYVTFVSLGFATVENILYTVSGGIFTGIIRAITTVPAHAFFGIASGYYLSLAKKNRITNNNLLKNRYLFLSIFIPFILHVLTTIMQFIQTTSIGNLFGTFYYLTKNIWALAFLHGFYDFCLLTENEILFLVYILFVIILYSVSISRVKKMMKLEERFVNNKKLYCSNCGMRVDTPYCSNCGKKID